VLLDDPIASSRLDLEPLGCAEGHARALFEGLQDPAIYQWISLESPESEASVEADLAQFRARRQETHDEVWLAWLARRRADGVYVGKLDADVVGTTATNVGYMLFRQHWGHGYATEAVRAVVAHLEGAGVTAFRATVTMGNAASARVLEKAGFVYTRVLPGNDTIRGEPVDDWEYVRNSAG
jgi:[ribosomal protein S5]-alanine N-acetyltransferase